ncbi:phage antirepressor KilAC domain-containing protein [Alicyclobacillus acidoterrestris]|uniref:Phage antirepressor KilAC domain-containing protein n=1 Tax=Alicyclobacillus acidoterrestris (strain ATCC 49025 / DSM 3922 / CIP 106132 / NCIMB 13137 / GD3B) TaxID=1356854 RepID=T0C3Y7_ALIAG|nr:phage antirepressor KilAC domain-containing protein [Alicyclobacillus acidoterrestris]EPZ47724.1 hypothetical protein N007_05575 [Alicyclobacillus acidoterrestris ATCC 49025]UNO47966.1 phage antirepressor KilAC domain-containing protein [Alicyclobacillus acidoterrestris]
MNELALVESRDVRERYMERVDVLDKVKALTMLPDDMHVAAKMVADYYEVDYNNVIKPVIHRHREELDSDGMVVLRGEELKRYKTEWQNATLTARSNLTLLPRRAVLRIGMLLRDSEVAKQVRTYLLNVEELAAPEHKQEAVDMMEVPKTFLEALKLAVYLEEKRQELLLENGELKNTISEMQPKVDVYEDLVSAENYMTIATVAKSMGWGRNKLFALLRDKNILRRDNTPYQRYIDNGYFSIRMVPKRVGDKIENFPQTIVSARGHEFIYNIVCKHNVFYLNKE